MLIRLIMACHWHPANSTYQFAYQLFTLAILSLSPQLSRGSLYDVYKEHLVLCNILHVMGNLKQKFTQAVELTKISERFDSLRKFIICKITLL